MVLLPQASYRSDEVDAYMVWAEAVMRRLRDEAVQGVPDEHAVLAEAHLEADRLVEEARRHSAELLRVALNELRAADGPAPGVVTPHRRQSSEVCYDAGEVDRYVAWTGATINQLQHDLDAARAQRRREQAAAQVEAERVLAEARQRAAAIVADCRRQLQSHMAAERARRVALASAPPAAPMARPVPPPVAEPAATPLPDPSPVAPSAPAAPPAPVAPQASAAGEMVEPVWARRGRLMRNTGVLIILFVLYQLFGTNVEANRTQRHLMSSFTRSLGPKPAAAAGSEATTPTSVPPSSALPPSSPLLGDAVAIIKIPSIGLEQAVVEGTTVADLRKGPGHYQGTPLPGEPGNSGIAGHRTTYGAPFNRMDELVPGDPIFVQTKSGTFRYEVSGHEVVKPSQVDVLAPKGDDRLTLTTCHPKYSARQRYVVWAALSTTTPPVRPVPPSAPSPPDRVSAGGDGSERPAGIDSPTIVSDGPSSFHVGALLPTLLWSLFLFAGWWATKRWRRAWQPAPVLASPVLAFALLHVFRSLSHFLPSNF